MASAEFYQELILNLFLVLLILVGVGIYLSFQSSSTTTAPARGALLVDLSGVVVDQPSVNNRVRQWGRELLGASSSRLQENSLFDVVDSIRKAKDDKNITGMVLQLNDFVGADQPSLRYIGKALREFRDSGKPIFAIGDSYNQTQYFLASYANKVYLSPQGAVDLHGFATNNLYYKSLLDMLKVTTNIFRVGTYKSAVEPLIRDDMSPAAREADSRWIGGLWQNYLETVAANRQLTPQQLFPGAAGVLSGLQAAGGDTARYALDNKLVDELASRTAIENQLVKTFGWDKQANDFNAISIYDYQPKPDANQGGKIAVVFANGAIMDGPQTPGNVGVIPPPPNCVRPVWIRSSRPWCSASTARAAASAHPK
ncbi:signal peptide peptidase SppA [Serratia ureilytica]